MYIHDGCVNCKYAALEGYEAPCVDCRGTLTASQLEACPDTPDLYAPATGDAVNQPNHYCIGGIEVIDYIRAKLSPEEFKGYCKGNVLKYLSRAGHKGAEAQDYAKAQKYMGWLAKEADKNV